MRPSVLQVLQRATYLSLITSRLACPGAHGRQAPPPRPADAQVAEVAVTATKGPQGRPKPSQVGVGEAATATGPLPADGVRPLRRDQLARPRHAPVPPAQVRPRRRAAVSLRLLPVVVTKDPTTPLVRALIRHREAFVATAVATAALAEPLTRGPLPEAPLPLTAMGEPVPLTPAST